MVISVSQNRNFTMLFAMKNADKTHSKVLVLRNQNHFDHYFSRLKTQFKGEEIKYADELLKIIATNDIISNAEAFDLSAKYSLQDQYKRILQTLMYDGYINIIKDSSAGTNG